MASFQVTPPDQFDFKKPADFEKWFVRFERFKTASGLSEKSQEQQVNALVYCMGKEADDILKSIVVPMLRSYQRICTLKLASYL